MPIGYPSIGIQIQLPEYNELSLRKIFVFPILPWTNQLERNRLAQHGREQFYRVFEVIRIHHLRSGVDVAAWNG